ncbi:hypothetical protein CMUS01_11594 [Colletotrichum musicola]|uniref:Uncharacterized protein n=1 Tax=Colletotrichum musicola TaxID=2175873 RepID=A0A8H6JVU2_9PEZI|nr:hypothetical protein CMUS01_11594 [Colletotrichum musicola]
MIHLERHQILTSRNQVRPFITIYHVSRRAGDEASNAPNSLWLLWAPLPLSQPAASTPSRRAGRVPPSFSCAVLLADLPAW